MSKAVTSVEVRAAGFISAPLAGGAYAKGLDGKALYHCVEVDADEQPVRVLCGRVKVEHVLDDVTQYDKHDVSCKTCLAKANRLTAHLRLRNDG